MLKSFSDSETEALWNTGKSRRIPASIRTAAMKKLTILEAAVDLNDLLIPPGNRLEALKHDRKGQHSIRINDKYRICFVWKDGDAYEIEIVDYH